MFHGYATVSLNTILDSAWFAGFFAAKVDIFQDQPFIQELFQRLDLSHSCRPECRDTYGRVSIGERLLINRCAMYDKWTNHAIFILGQCAENNRIRLRGFVISNLFELSYVSVGVLGTSLC
jgi:hypothetical protein